MKDIVVDILKNKYADFNGRARRYEFWNWYFALLLYMWLISRLSKTSGFISIVSILLIIAILIPNFAVSVRRLHDMGKSGWWLLLITGPAVGSIMISFVNVSVYLGILIVVLGLACSIWLLVLMCIDSQRGVNEYGPNPKGL